ncbi:DUF4498-like protein [Aureococcus anophagefferens]|nr:DUF4498-like protein [Aureococcus anophagefferens]
MEDVQLPSLKTRDARECLARWGLAGLRVGRFRYEFQGDVDGRNAAAFVAGLLDTPGVRAWLNAEAPADAAVEATRLATTATSMALFDPLVECAEIALPTGGARQCPEVRFGVAVDDELRKWLLVTAGFGADDDDVDPWSARPRPSPRRAPRSSLLAVGAMSQPDYALAPYLDLARPTATWPRSTGARPTARSPSRRRPCVAGPGRAQRRHATPRPPPVEPKKRSATLLHSDGGGGAWWV